MTGCTSQRKDKLQSQKESEISFSTPNVSTRLEFILCKGSLLDYHEFCLIIWHSQSWRHTKKLLGYYAFCCIEKWSVFNK
jgi:hypothetical protein